MKDQSVLSALFLFGRKGFFFILLQKIISVAMNKNELLHVSSFSDQIGALSLLVWGITKQS